MHIQPKTPPPKRRAELLAAERAGADHRPEFGRPAEEADPVSLPHLLRTVWANRWLLIAATALGVGFAVWQLSSEVPLYTARAQVVLQTDQKRMIDFDGVAPRFSLTYVHMNTELGVLQSSELMGRAAAALSLAQDPEFNPALRDEPDPLFDTARLWAWAGPAADPEAEAAPAPAAEPEEVAAGILRSKVSVARDPESLIYTISVQTEGAEKSARIANAIAELYVDGQRQAKFDALQEALTWLGTEAVGLKEELEAAEAAVEAFSADADLVSEEALVGTAQRLKSMRTRQEELAVEGARLREEAARLEALRAAGDFAALATVTEPRLSVLARELAGQEPEEAALARFDAGLERWLGTLRTDAENADSQAAAAARSVAELEESVNAQSADVVALRQLQREAEATRLIYESFLTRLKELSVQQGIQQADSRVLTVASAPGSPSHPKRTESLARGGALGLALGLMLVWALNALRTSVRTPQELEEASGLPVLGVIPDERSRRPDRLLDRLVENPTSAYAEAIRNLRTGIQLSNVDRAPQVVQITSSAPDEGKSVLATALAQTSALSGKRVLLIEADLRRRVLGGYLGMNAEAGLVRMLSGEASFSEVVQRDDRTGLDLLFADTARVTPVDVFESQKFRTFIAEAREAYDLIVFDTPPVLAVPETRVIAQQADAVVYAVRWNSTQRRLVRAGLDLLAQVNVRVAGVALTRVAPRRSVHYGYYGYGYGRSARKLKRYYAS